jgi:ElaB/YqjD/DUF883 family membrane-anchored ribosome-binding protein
MNRTNVDEQGQRVRDEERQEGRPRHISERVRRRMAGEEGGIEMDRLREVGRNIGSQLEEQVQKRPYVVIGAAAGIGFVAGSLFGSRLGQMLLAAGIGYLVKNVVNGDIGVDRIQERLERLTQEGRENG